MKKWFKTVLILLILIYPLLAVADVVLQFEPVWDNGKTPAAQACTATGMEFVFVKGGCFQMGSNSGGDNEKPAHEVCVDDFYIGKHEVTQTQYQKISGRNLSIFKGDNRPVENVSWSDTQDYIRKLDSRSGKKYRLPTEAEWEYAAGSGGKAEKWAGTSSEPLLGSYAWYNKNSSKQTHMVGQRQANELGLYDMSGNVWEWCSDRYGSKYYSQSPRKNPQGPSSGTSRVLRGGSWNSGPGYLRSASRFWSSPSRGGYAGFRLVLPVGQ